MALEGDRELAVVSNARGSEWASDCPGRPLEGELVLEERLRRQLDKGLHSKLPHDLFAPSLSINEDKYENCNIARKYVLNKNSWPFPRL